MYRSYYSLAKKPFQITTDPKFLWLGEKHKEALATLKYGVIDQKGFLLVTGDVGTGKTTLINALLEGIEEDTLVANITDPALNLIEFFNFVALSFNIPEKFDSKIDFIVYFSQFLKKVYSENRNVLLIIDEVHSLSKEVLEHIRLLSNIELPEEKLVNIFFVGQNEIHQTLALPECRALRQRISLVYQIEPLSENETMAYIKHRLKVAGTEKSIFTIDAVREIYNFSKGYPRLINTICDHALLTGYARELIKITPNIIMECAQHFNSLGVAWNNYHANPHAQPHLECPPHSTTCPMLNDLTGKAALSENAGTEVLIMPQKEKKKSREQINPSEETLNNSAEVSDAFAVRPKQKIQFFRSTIMSFVTRIQKEVFSQASAAAPVIKRIFKRFLSWASAALLFVKRTQIKLFSWVSGLRLPTLFQKRWLFWTSAACLTLIILVFTGLYQKAQTTKNNPPEPTPTVVSSDTSASSPNILEDHSISHNDQLNVAEITPAPPKKEIPHPVTDIPKPDVLAQAKTALHNKKFSRAIELFEQYIAQHPANAITIKTYYSKALQGQAGIVFLKNAGEAETLLSKAIEADSENGGAHFDLGRLYTKSKNYPKAIKAYQKAANLNHRPTDVFYNLGFIYASIKDFANAEKMFFHVVDLKPPYLDKALFNLAVVQQQQGKKQQCIENLEKALINNPENQRAHQYLNQLKNDKEVF